MHIRRPDVGVSWGFEPLHPLRTHSFHRHLGSLYTDFTLPPGGPYSLQCLYCRLVFISERLMSYLLLPSKPFKPELKSGGIRPIHFKALLFLTHP